MDTSLSEEFSLDEAVFLKKEDLIKAHAPFNLSKTLVHPVRITMTTVENIWSHRSCDWYYESIELMEFIHTRHSKVKPVLYDKIISIMKQKSIICSVSSDASVGKEKSKRLINEYFPVESIPTSSPYRQTFMKLLNDDTSIMRLVKDQLKDKTKHKNLMNLLKRYFTAIEEELPEPLNNSSLYVFEQSQYSSYESNTDDDDDKLPHNTSHDDDKLPHITSHDDKLPHNTSHDDDKVPHITSHDDKLPHNTSHDDDDKLPHNTSHDDDKLPHITSHSDFKPHIPSHSDNDKALGPDKSSTRVNVMYSKIDWSKHFDFSELYDQN